MMNEYSRPPSYDECSKFVASPSGPNVNNGFQYDSVASPTAPMKNDEFQDSLEFAKPPTAPPLETSGREPVPVVNLGSLSEEDIRGACLQYASEHCCYGKRFIRDMILIDITNTHTYHYRLESFGEKRETALRAEPYRGQFIDGPENGTPPSPWDIPIRILDFFVDKTIAAEVPHTAYVKECSRCVGNRRVRCELCHGRGGSMCFNCRGIGRSNGQQCTSCFGSGRLRCFSCSGTGQVKCKTCDGRGKLKHFKQLIVTWKNHAEDFVSNTLSLPKPLIRSVSGRELLKEQKPQVAAIRSPNLIVNEASSVIISKHHTAFPKELIRMQRQTLRVIPLTKTKYTWKNKTGEFYIYGFQKKVFFENYPQKFCCCTCS